jgi:hypothetical protein
VPGSDVCHYHGGKSRRGIAAPSFKHGKYSNALPGRMLDAYKATATDAELVGLREELRLVDTRLQELVEQIDRQPSRALWSLIDEMVDAAISAETPTARESLLLQMRQQLRSAPDDSKAWKEILSTVERRRKLVDSEAKRLQRMHQMISVEKAMTLVGAIVGSVRSHVTDANTLAKIQSDLTVLLARPIGPGES